MKVTGGRLRGRSLPHRVPEGVRPTSSRVREALFNIVGQDLRGQRVLDCYGGSGMLSLEAWSRGAEVVVVERDRTAQEAILRAARALGAELDLRRGASPRAIPPGLYDLVLVDPPYALPLEEVLPPLAPFVGGRLVVEHLSRVEAPALPSLELERSRRYGDTTLSFYRPSEGSGR